ncbi:hypothetical protein HU200_030702 [Digitaria exilis]|uniref:Secreted protein n=1 Tax=Digitaria exilis TaxID=1010633 RepID=A0A835EN53_9POAL|nr:hypothetical protein HU200_030702 [Digitaria exilis]
MLIFLHLLILSSPAAAAATPTGTTLQPPDDAAQGWAAARRLLLRQPKPAATGTATFFHVDVAARQAAATSPAAKPNVEFNASTKSAPGSRFNPKQN